MISVPVVLLNSPSLSPHFSLNKFGRILLLTFSSLLCLINSRFLITKCLILYVLCKEKLSCDDWELIEWTNRSNKCMQINSCFHGNKIAWTKSLKMVFLNSSLILYFVLTIKINAKIQCFEVILTSFSRNKFKFKHKVLIIIKMQKNCFKVIMFLQNYKLEIRVMVHKLYLGKKVIQDNLKLFSNHFNFFHQLLIFPSVYKPSCSKHEPEILQGRFWEISFNNKIKAILLWQKAQLGNNWVCDYSSVLQTGNLMILLKKFENKHIQGLPQKMLSAIFTEMLFI